MATERQIVGETEMKETTTETKTRTENTASMDNATNVEK